MNGGGGVNGGGGGRVSSGGGCPVSNGGGSGAVCGEGVVTPIDMVTRWSLTGLGSNAGGRRIVSTCTSRCSSPPTPYRRRRRRCRHRAMDTEICHHTSLTSRARPTSSCIRFCSIDMTFGVQLERHDVVGGIVLPYTPSVSRALHTERLTRALSLAL